MVDIVSKEVRSRMMSGIRSKNTKPEMMLRKELHSRGFRFRIHDPKLPGKPDLVLPKYNSVIFVHGCFWHGHNCKFFKMPSTRTEFWKTKIDRNQSNDKRKQELLRNCGWRIATIWECTLRGQNDAAIARLFAQVCIWLKSTQASIELQ